MASSADTVTPGPGGATGTDTGPDAATGTDTGPGVATGTDTGPYGLAQPTLAEALAALRRLYGPHTGDIWQSLLARAGLTGAETDIVSFDRLVNCMNTAEPITRLCGRSLGVRAAAHRRLAAAHQPRSAEA